MRRWFRAFAGFALCAALVCLTSLSAQDYVWEYVTDSPKMAGLGQAAVVAGDALYVLRAGTTGTYQFHAYSFSSEVWNSLEVPPERPKNGTALAWDGGQRIYALLGAAYNETGRRFFYRFDLASGAWESLADTPQDQGAGNALVYALVAGRASLLATVGAATRQRRGATSTFLRYDVVSGQWEDLEDLPSGWTCTDDGVALAWDGALGVYALRGCNCEGMPTTGFARYDLGLGTWTVLPPVPEVVNDGGSLVWDGGAYLYAIVGGFGEQGSDGRGIFRFSIPDKYWEDDLPRLPCPVGYANGNRLGFLAGNLVLWQGGPRTWPAGGTGVWILVSR